MLILLLLFLSFYIAIYTVYTFVPGSQYFIADRYQTGDEDENGRGEMQFFSQPPETDIHDVSDIL